MKPNDKPVLVYVTCPSLDVARTIGGQAVERRLAACANILPQMQSIYVWQGALHQDDEVVLLLKTRQACADAVTALVEREHPYDTPAVLVLPVEGGSGPFLAWIAEETSTALPERGKTGKATP